MKPEEFIRTMNLISNTIYENILSYRTCCESLRKYKNDYDEVNNEYNNQMNQFIPEEKKLLNKLNFEKNRNFFLNEKLKSIKIMILNEKNTLIKIVMKLKAIILDIDSKINIKNKKDMKLWNFVLTSKRKKYEDTNVAIKISSYILQIIEQFIGDLIQQDNEYKNNPQLKDDYRRIYNDNEKQNNYYRSKLKLSLEKKKLEERTKHLILKLTKDRIGSLEKRKTNYENSIIKKKVLKEQLMKKRLEINNNRIDEQFKWFSFQ